MEAVLLVIHLVVALGIIALVLIQPAEAGGFLGSSGSNMMMPRRSADTLTRLTTILAGCFFATSLLLAILAGGRAPQKNILDIAAEDMKKTESAAPAAPESKAEKPAPAPAKKDAPPETPKAPISR